MIDTADFFRSVVRATRDLVRPAILLQAVWPPLAAFFGWSLIAWFAWLPLAQWIAAELPDWQWLNWLGPWLAHVAVFFLFVPLIYFTTLLLVAAFALPRMMAIIAARDYPDVSRHGSGAAAFWGSLGNTLAAGAIFIIGWLITLPLLLIPGGLLVLPLFWAAWLNQRAFRFDALAEHAQPQERKAVVERSRGSLYLGGLLGALLSYVPVLHLVALPWTAILFVHLCLGGLRELRREKGVVL